MSVRSLIVVAALGFFSVGSVASAQVSVEEAQARLSERRAKESSAPTTQPTETEASTLRNALAHALAEVERLKGENADLRRKVAEMDRSASAPATAVKGKADAPKIGDSEDDVRAWAKANNLVVKVVSESATEKVIDVAKMVAGSGPLGSISTRVLHARRLLSYSFENGKVVSVDRY